MENEISESLYCIFIVDEHACSDGIPSSVCSSFRFDNPVCNCFPHLYTLQNSFSNFYADPNADGGYCYRDPYKNRNGYPCHCDSKRYGYLHPGSNKYHYLNTRQ